MVYGVGFNEAAGIPRGRLTGGERLQGVSRASMRPRVFPAEDDTETAIPAVEADDASMRPRVFPAEDAQAGADLRRRGEASMRPRVFPAEDSTTVIEPVEVVNALQ